MLRITGNQPVPHWKEALARFMKERKGVASDDRTKTRKTDDL